MTYITSDLHGYKHENFLKLLEKTGFSADDELYVLGDVIDRNGDGGIETYQWMMKQPNVHLLRGNHEDMLLKCLFLFDGTAPEAISDDQYAELRCWLWNGGRVTIDSLTELLTCDPNAFTSLISYIQAAPLYKELTVNGKNYILTHAGLGNYKEGKPLSAYGLDDLVWFRPEPDTKYGTDACVVCGHTPVTLFGRRYAGKAFRTDTWIDIDTGAAHGGDPMLLRLEDEKEFYIKG